MTIDFPFMTRLSPADAIRVWRHEYEQWKEQTRLLKQFERDRIFCPSASDADQRQHRGWTAALLAKGEGLGLQMDDLPIDVAERARLREAIAVFLDDFRDTLLGYWMPRQPADPRLAVLGG